ncbi:MAG: hypothetical protein WCE21_00925 [Candidatus Babeliales bacterium]
MYILNKFFNTIGMLYFIRMLFVLIEIVCAWGIGKAPHYLMYREYEILVYVLMGTIISIALDPYMDDMFINHGPNGPMKNISPDTAQGEYIRTVGKIGFFIGITITYSYIYYLDITILLGIIFSMSIMGVLMQAIQDYRNKI